MISIIIVNYYVKEELFNCIRAIKDSRTITPYEIIIIDNDGKKTIQDELKEKFPDIRYIPNKNLGFGQACNIGAKHAHGDFLFFLNPDTEVYDGCIDNLFSYLNTRTEVGIVAPVLYHRGNKPFALQGLGELTPFSAIFALSFINKLFPQNFISKKYWNSDWDKKSIKEVYAIPGTAFLIRKTLFDKVGRFDKRFFLYFEETDLCKRVENMGLKIIMLPLAKVYHAWGSSTKKSNRNINKIFINSRYYFFKKHYGLLQALFVETILRFSKISLLILLITIGGLIIRVYNINKYMPFIGDQGWFYLSARNIIVNGNIPLVGITSSHTWLHQGALWTYILAISLFFGKFNPLSGAYISIGFDVISIFLLYRLGSLLFSARVGLLAAFLYAFSPAVILNSRMPYHTSLIPFFTIIFIYSLYKWLKQGIQYFPLVILALAILYNFELATFTFVYLIIAILFIGMWKKKKWVKGFFKKKNVIYSIIAFSIPMAPMIIYDTTHRYVQTLGFLIWNLYKFISLLNLPHFHQTGLSSFSDMVIYALYRYQLVFFGFNFYIALLILILTLFYIIYTLIRDKNSQSLGLQLSIYVTIFSVGGLIASRTPSGAYLPMIYPTIVLLTAYFFAQLIKIKRHGLSYLTLLILIIFQICNTNFLLYYKYNPSTLHYFTYQDMLNATDSIIRQTNGKAYNLKGEGGGSQFATFTMSYEYLLWWEGNAPSKNKQKILFIIQNNAKGDTIIKEYINDS